MLLFFLILVVSSASTVYSQPLSLEYVHVDFNRSMASIRCYQPTFVEIDFKWQLAKKLYDKHSINLGDDTSQASIPKIIHQIWLGSPLPEKCKILRESWLKYHPTWIYTLWTDADIENFGLINQERYDASQNYGEKSDIARYEILDRCGGLYIDTDFECLQSFDSIHQQCDFYAGITSEPELVVFNGLIASRPGHPILKECINRLKTSPSTTSDILQRTGPFFFTACILSYARTTPDRVVLFPTTYFYPWPWYERSQNSRREIESWIKPETLAIHHWHVSWLN